MCAYNCWGLDSSSDVEVYKIGVESGSRNTISRASQNDVLVQEMPISLVAPCFCKEVSMFSFRLIVIY